MADPPVGWNKLIPVKGGSVKALRAAAKDAVNNPAHYQGEGLQAIDVIEAFNLNFNRGNIVKYALRAGRKHDTIEDLKKLVWYAEREISHINKQNANK